jgi:hypothetical protein
MNEHVMLDDPARDVPPAAHSEQATALLNRIVAVARHDAAHPRRPASAKRIAVGGLLAAAVVTVAVAAPMPWDGDHSGTTAAYAVDRHHDGSVSIVVHWNQLSDPARLQQALDAAGAPVRILTGTDLSGSTPPTNIPDCAKPYSGNPYSADAVSWDSGRNAPDNGFVIRPTAFPAHGTLVIEVFFAAGTHRMVSTLSFMAIGRAPTCALPG